MGPFTKEIRVHIRPSVPNHDRRLRAAAAARERERLLMLVHGGEVTRLVRSLESAQLPPRVDPRRVKLLLGSCRSFFGLPGAVTPGTYPVQCQKHVSAHLFAEDIWM